MALLLTTLVSIGTNLISNRIDAKVVTAYDQLQKLKNHDLHRALWRAFYEAQKELCEVCKVSVTMDEVRWLEQCQADLDDQLMGLDNNNDLNMPIQTFGDVSLLLAPLESQPVLALQALKEQLLAAAETDGAPAAYVSLLRDRLHDEMSSHFEAELKVDPRTETIVTARQGAQNYAVLMQHTDLLERIWRAVQAPLSLPAPLQLPYQPNPFLTGREALLDEVRVQLNAPTPKKLPVVLHGLGGVGKTQAAVEYASRYQADYTEVIWISANSRGALEAGYVQVARMKGLLREAESTSEHVRLAVRSWLSTHPGWLMIFDDAEEPRDLLEFLPPSGVGDTLITSRNPNWARVARAVAVHKLSDSQGASFLLRRTGQNDRMIAEKLSRAMDGLPLALEQAGAFLEATGMSMASYLERYEDLLLDDSEEPADYSRTVATTWNIAFAEVEQNPVGAGLIYLASFLGPDAIPLDVIQTHTDLLPPPLKGLFGGTREMDEARKVLRRYSLVTMSEDYLSVHRVVQAVVRHRLPKAEQQLWSGAALQLMTRAFRFDELNMDSWHVCARLLSHAMAATEYTRQYRVMAGAASHLLSETACYLRMRGDLQGAQALLGQAVVLAEREYGSADASVAEVRYNLARVLMEAGDMLAAKAHLERALAIDEATHGLQHEVVGLDVNALGMVLRELGDFLGAKASLERALAIVEDVYGPYDAWVASCTSNLGLVLEDLGDLAAAKDCYERALKVNQAALGPVHPYVATSANNLGMLLSSLGNHADARRHVERAIAVDEAVFGHDHPSVALRVYNLATILLKIGDLAGAKAQLERALDINAAKLGDHRMTVICARGLGVVLYHMGDFRGALDRAEQALNMAQSILPPNDPDRRECKALVRLVREQLS